MCNTDVWTLPIERVRGRFEAVLQTGAPVVVSAPTGSGKSTRLPVWLAERSRAGVLVVEPRRVACRALATWVAAGRGGRLGDEVGYRVRFDDRSGPNTRILFVTPGVALGMLGEGAADRFAALVLDEFHERSWQIDLVAALARKDRPPSSDAPLVLCSATLDIDGLQRALGAALVEADGRTHPVLVTHTGDGPPTPRDLEVRVAEAVRNLLGEPGGDILVFLPGKKEIERCAAALAGVTTVAVHGGLPPGVLTRAFAPTTDRRVFLATNVAETSLTLPGVTAVVDSGLVRTRMHQAGRSVLALVPTSAASMDQRAGRAGRVGPGCCVRLWSPRFEPSATTPPEIERVELDDLILRAAACGVEAGELEQLPWVTPPPGFALEAARGRLHAQGSLAEDGRVTARGRRQAALPVSSMAARMLAEPPGSLAGTLADLVALMEVRRDLLLHGSAIGERRAVEDARRELLRDAKDEVEVQLRCLRDGDSRRHGLHAGALDEARRLARALREQLGVGARSREHAVPVAEVVPHLLRRIPEAAFVVRERSGRRSKGRARHGAPERPWGNGESELVLRDFAVPGLVPEEQPPPPVAAIVLDAEWLGVGRGARGRGRLALRVALEDLLAAGLGETAVGRPRIDRIEGAKVVVAELEQHYAGVVLRREPDVLHGAALCEAVASLILDGRLRKGLASKVLDAMHSWAVLSDWVAALGPAGGRPPASSPEDPRAWLGQRLVTHGVERLADLDLLDDDDLLPELESMALDAGMSPRELAALHDDFPRTWSFPGGLYRCRVDVARRLVILEPDHPTTRNEPPAKYLPRFRGFAVEYRKASRRVRLR